MSSYQTVTPADTQALSSFLSHHGQLLLPMVQLIEQSQAALDEVVDVTFSPRTDPRIMRKVC